jgi:hypothetical protein
VTFVTLWSQGYEAGAPIESTIFGVYLCTGRRSNSHAALPGPHFARIRVEARPTHLLWWPAGRTLSKEAPPYSGGCLPARACSADANLPTEAGWRRQILHGQRYFEDRFGVGPNIGVMAGLAGGYNSAPGWEEHRDKCAFKPEVEEMGTRPRPCKLAPFVITTTLQRYGPQTPR